MLFRHPIQARLLVLIALISLLLGSAAGRPALAYNGSISQETVTLESVAVDIWPEYDQPGVLVMYNITVSSEVKLPASLTFSIPASAGQPHAVATKDTNGLYNLQYDSSTTGDWIKINFTTSMPELRIEYYDPSLARQNNEREFTYLWPGDYSAKNLTIQIQQPVNASNMKFNENLGSGFAAQDGLTYYTLAAGPQEAGKELRLDLSYTKPDSALTNPGSFQQAQPSQRVDDQTSGRITLNEIIPWTLGLLGIMLIGTGVWWYWRAGRKAAPAASRPRHAHRSKSPATSGAAATPDGGIYCHQCGKRAAGGDLFCRACGTKLR